MEFSAFRFCNKLYQPFDPKDRKKYVVSDDFLPIWEVGGYGRNGSVLIAWLNPLHAEFIMGNITV